MTGRIKTAQKKTSLLSSSMISAKPESFKYRGYLPLDFLEMSSPEKYQECQTGFEKVMDSLLKSKKMTLVESRKNGEDVIHDNRILGFRMKVAVLDVCADKKNFIGVTLRRMKFTTSLSVKVIIDNRPTGFPFVEESRIFGGKKGTGQRWWLFCVIISTGGESIWLECVVISAKLPPGDFFDAVAERIKAGCRPGAVVFSFLAISLSAMPYSFVMQLQMQRSFMECLNASMSRGEIWYR